MSKLVWRPQKAFADYFYTDKKEILKRRTVIREDYDHFVSYGGRGSAKTWTWSDAVVVEASLRPVRVLVTREIQNSIDESIKAEIEAAIEYRGIGDFFQILDKEIRGANGSKFIFKGIRNNINNLKSIADVDIVLCEESENIPKKSWDKLLPSIRPKSGRPIIIIIFNPEEELDDTYQRWVVNPPPRTISKCINWRDNKYFPEHLERQRQHSLKTRPKKEHDHVWEGKPKAPHSDVIIDLEWVKAARFASKIDGFIKTEGRTTSYDPAGQGKDYHAVVSQDGNIIDFVDEWPISPDLREASNRAFDSAIELKSDKFKYDECGGFGDGVDVFIKDRLDYVKSKLKNELSKAKEEKDRDKEWNLQKELAYLNNFSIIPFNAGDAVVYPNQKIEGTDKTWGEMYYNAKAQAWAIYAQKLYNTYRFVRLGEKDADDLISIDIEDDLIFNKLAKELSTPIWVRSATNSKRRVETKKDMEKRTGQPSPNIADSAIMNTAPEVYIHIDDSIAGPVTTGSK